MIIIITSSQPISQYAAYKDRLDGWFNELVACFLLVLQPQKQNDLLDVPANEEGDEDISGTQFVCETVIRSLTLEEEPERKPKRRARPNLSKNDSKLEFVALTLIVFLIV